MATLTVYSDTSDGGLSSSNATYATARTGGTLAVENPGGTRADIGQLYSATYFCYETFLSFDTSALPDDATITSVTLYLHGATQSAIETAFTVEVRLYDWGSSLTTADWIAGENLGSQTLLASRSTAGWSTSAYNDFTSEAAFVNNVSKTGSTRLIVCSSRHRLGSAPSTGSSADTEYVRIVTAEQSGTTQDPKLVIEYDVAVDLGTAQMAAVSSLTAALTSTTYAASIAAAASLSAQLSVSTAPAQPDYDTYDFYANQLPLIAYEDSDYKATTTSRPPAPPRQDNAASADEMRPESGFFFAQSEFVGGAGQKFFHHTGRDDSRFLQSEGVDITDPAQIKLLYRSQEAHDSANIGSCVVAAGLPLVADGTVVKRGDGNFAGTWTSEVVGGVTVNDLAAEGAQVFAAVNSTTAPLYVRAAGGTTWAVYQSGGTNITLDAAAATFITYHRGRLFVTRTRGAYEVTGSTATPTNMNPLASGWEYQKPFAHGKYVYICAVNTDAGLSEIHHFGLNSAGTGYEFRGITEADVGELFYAGVSAAGAVYLVGGKKTKDGGADPIFYKASADSDGFLTLIKVAEETGSTSTDLSSRAIKSVGGKVIFGWSLKAASNSGALREGLAVFHLGRGAFAHYLSKTSPAATPNRIRDIASYKGRVLWAINGDGLYYEDIGTYLASGTLVTSAADFNQAGSKIFTKVELVCKPLPAGATIDADYTTVHPEEASWNNGVAISATGATGGAGNLGNTTARLFGLRIELNSTTDQTGTPEFVSYTVTSFPAPETSEWDLTRYVYVARKMRKKGGRTIMCNPKARRLQLHDLINTVITWSEPDATWTTRVVSVGDIEPAQPRHRTTDGSAPKEFYIVALRLEGTRD